jgi:acetaldehyde dehydrogenase/alcohol dehydrogenase
MGLQSNPHADLKMAGASMAMPVPEREPGRRFAEDESAALAQYARQVSFPTGTCIFKAGSPGDCCYFIDEGRVRLELNRNELDSEDVLGFLDAGSVLGEIAILDGQPRSASAYAHTDVQARRVSKEDVERLGETNPRALASLYLSLGRNAAGKLRATNERLVDAIFPSHDPEVEDLVARAAAAQTKIQGWSEEQIDAVLLTVAQSFAVKARELAEDTVRVTRIGNVPDKVSKNVIASMGVYRSLAGQPASGVLSTDEERKVSEIACAAGVVVGIIPATNPGATAIFKALIAIKSRNALILSFPRGIREVGPAIGTVIQDALVRAGAPGDLLQWIKHGHSRKKTEILMSHPKVSLVLATGGASMVRAAYGSGTPTIGVGPGNAPTLICADADLDYAAQSVVMSKSFDNGLVCGSENNLIVLASIRESFVAALIKAGAAVLTPGETAEFDAVVIDPETQHFRPEITGQGAGSLAEYLGIKRDYPIELIVVPADAATGPKAYGGEKMAPLLSLFTVADVEEGLALSLDLLQREGMGHTAVIHTKDPGMIDRFAAAMPVSRILANSPASHGVIGFTTGLMPSLTLGCGTFGGNSTTDNVSYRNLLNIKRLAHYLA